MTCVKAKDFTQIYNAAIENIKVGIPIELLRMFQESVKNMIYEQNNPEALPVKGLDDVSEKDLKAFFIGSKPVSDNTSLFSVQDILNDILFNDNSGLPQDTEKMLTIIHDEKVRFPKDSYIPLYKYVKKNSKYSIDELTNVAIKNKSKIKANIIKYTAKSFEDMEELIKNSSNDMISIILLCNCDLLSKEYLRKKLITINPNKFKRTDKVPTATKKLICLLDYMENK